MESTEANSIDDSLDSKNLEASMEDIVVAKYEDCNSEDLSSQNEEDQSGEQVYGYLEVRNPGSEDATIILDSEGFNLNGQKLILTQGDDGNGIIVLVNEDPNQPLEQTFANASVLHPDDVNFDEDGLKEHGTLVMDEHSQGLEFIETEEVPQEHEERHVYIENSGGFINISSETQCDSVNIEQPLWSVSNNAQIKNDSTEMLFIPNPTVVLAPEETKHRKLMQLACIAHELQSADQKSSIAAVSESAKNVETPLNEFETSVIVTRNEGSKDPNEDLVGTSAEVKDHENTECLPSNDCENNHLDINSKSVSKSVDVSSLVRAVDNTVSVIHTTSSELQDNSLENQVKDSSPSDFSSVKNYHTPESELPSEMLYPSGISKVSLHDSLSEEPSNTKQLDECTREDLEDTSQLAIADDSNESKSPRPIPNVTSREMELDCSPGDDDDSPITFIEKSQKLDGVDTLGIEDNPLGEAGADIRVDDDDSHADPCIAVDEDDGFKEANESSNPAATKDTFSAEENHLLKDSGINQRTQLMKNKVPADADSELSTSDNDDTGIHDHGSSTSKADIRFVSKKYLYKYKTKSHKSYLAKKYTSSPVQDSSSEINCPYTLNESNMEDSSANDENDKSEPMDFENSPPDNSESDLVIAENADEEEFKSVNDSMPKNETQKSTTEDTVESNKIQSIENVNFEKDINSVEKNSGNSEKDFVQELPADSQPVCKEVDNENSSVKAAPSSLDSSAVDDDFSYNEETLVKTPIKTYIRKKVKKNIVENKSSIKQNIELFSVDDLNFSECDKDINDVENSLNSDHCKESVSSSPENNAETDDLLLSDVQSKVSATYNRKRKSVLPLKQGLRTRSLRPRSLPAKLPLENGTQEISDSESKKNSFDSSSSENIPWGDVLMSTSFQPRAETNKDEPSTSYASRPIIASSTPLSPEQQKRKLKYTRDFERLLHSSPVSSKKLKTNKKRQIQRGRKKLLKSRQSNVLPTSSYSEFLGPYETSNLYNVGASTSTGGHKKRREVKKAKIQYLNQNTIKCHEEPGKQKKELFSCSTCNFVSRMVDNLIEHLKYCKNIQPVFSYCVNDMEKRQMIRGDDSFDKEEVTGGCNGTVRNNERRNSSHGEFSGGQSQDPDESLDLDFISNNKKRKKTQYGYGEDDVVWVKYKDRFWPALVCEIRGSKAHVRLIKHPEADKGLKVKHENIRTFDDAKWNCLCLKEAVNLPNKEIFVTSVQSAETFMRRKFLGLDVRGKTFFSVREGVDFATDTASSDSIVDDSDDDDDEAITIRYPAPSRKFRYETLDKERILGYILEGSVNDYVLDIYNEKVHSDKHIKFFDPEGRADLEHRPWFGPFEEKSEKERLFFHFRDLFSAKVGEDTCKKRKFGMTAYVTQVLIPEAIVKAISVVNDISIEAAETLFESEDSLDMDCDPEPGEIHKMYS